MTDNYEVYFENEPSYTVDFTELQNFIVKVGKDGVGIARMGYSYSNGLVDTYIIILTDGTSMRFNVTNGHTPVRGTDYWTDEDIAVIKAYVDKAILGGKW